MPTEQDHSTEGADWRWAQAFPHVANAPGVDGYIEGTGRDVWRTLAMSAAATARVLDSVALEEHFPLIREDPTEIGVLRLDTRSSNALTREGIRTIGELARRSSRDVASLRQAGQRTVRTITNKLAWLNAERALGISDVSVVPAPGNSVEDHPRVLTQDMNDALRIVAGWHVLRGQPDSRLWSDLGLDGAPARVLDAWAQLQGLTAKNVVEADAPGPSAVLDELLAQEDPRNLQILTRRLFADHPETLDAIGHDLNVTRERVRQIARKTTSRLQSELTGHQEGLVDLSAALRQRIGIVSSLERVLAVYPSLMDVVAAVAQPAWRVIDRLDDSFEICDGWAAVPSVSAAIDVTWAEARRAANGIGLASVTDVAAKLGFSSGERNSEFELWLQYANLQLFRESIVLDVRSIADWAVIVLAQEERPLSVSELSDLIPVERAETSVRNAIAIDERIVRVNRDSFALATWGMETYSGIRELIGRHLDDNGGSIDLETLVVDLTTKFDVADTSVRAYASSFPYELRAGRVTRQNPDGRVREGNLGTARRAYATPKGVCFRFQVTPDHWRGSGSVMPSDLARSIGLSEGESLTLASPLGDQTVYWTGLQPSIGSVKRLVERLQAEPGAWVMAEFGADGEFSLRKLDLARRSGVALAQVMTGTEGERTRDARAAIATALSLPEESDWASVIAAAKNRGEDELVTALMSDPAVETAGDTALRSVRGDEQVTADDILELL